MDGPFLVVGLGNPGARYRNTRHNAGALLVERIASTHGQGWRNESKFFSELAEVRIGGKKVLLCKPQTFMNLSGEAVVAVSRFYRIDDGSILVGVDDADLPMGTLRLKPSGGSGGHHGLDSIAEHLGSRVFPRLRLGIARPASSVRDIAGHVLGEFSGDERAHFDRVLQRAESQVETTVRDGLQKAMNLYNGEVE
jgi:peptidyl-tRNA hydrolase, PTH1 family